MKNLMGNSAMPQYIKVLAAGMLCATYLGALAVYGVDLLNNIQPSAVVVFVLGTGVSMAAGVLNLHTGAQLAETPPTGPVSQLQQLPAPAPASAPPAAPSAI